MTMGEQMDVIRKHQDAPPVQTVPIAEDLGLRVYRSGFGQWNDSVSGLIRKEADGKFSIYVNSSHNVRRRRFTIAHEIGHFILHKDEIGDGVVDDMLYRGPESFTSRLTSEMEAQANHFAADILMPWHLLDAELEKGVADVTELAKTFDVSPSSMSIRLGVPYETTE